MALTKTIVNIDEETGEIFNLKENERGEYYIGSKQDDIRRKNFFNDKKKYAEIKDLLGNFIFSAFNFNHNIENAKDKLNESEIVRLVYLSTYVGYDNVLRYDNGITVKKNDLQNLLGIEKATVFYLITKLENLNIISFNSKLEIIMNKDLFFKGNLKTSIINEKDKNEYFTKIFINGIRYIYKKNNPRQHKRLIDIFLIIPYINIQHNIICLNPLECNMDSIKPLNIKEFCDILNITNRSRFKKTLKNIEVDGYSLFGFMNVKNDEYIIANPKIIYNGNDVERLKFIMMLFEMSKNNKES